MRIQVVLLFRSLVWTKLVTSWSNWYLLQTALCVLLPKHTTVVHSTGITDHVLFLLGGVKMLNLLHWYFR